MYEDRDLSGGTDSLSGTGRTLAQGIEFAFDLQRFAGSAQVVENGVLKLKWEKLGGDSYLVGANDTYIYAVASGKEYQLTDVGQTVYGTVSITEMGYNIYLSENASSLKEIQLDDTSLMDDSFIYRIYNSHLLSETTKCIFKSMTSLDLQKADDPNFFLNIYTNGENAAEVNIRKDSSVANPRNARLYSRNSYVVLPNGTRVTDKDGCNLVADAEGNTAVTLGKFSADGEVPLAVQMPADEERMAANYPEEYVIEVLDSSGNSLAKCLSKYGDGVHDFAANTGFQGTYDAKTKALSPVQGVFEITAGEDKYYYVADTDSKSIGIYQEGEGSSLDLVTKRYYDSDVSFQLAASYENLPNEADFGLTSDLVTVTIDGNADTLTIPDLQGKKGAIYQDKTGETRYAVIEKTETGFTMSVDSEKLTAETITYKTDTATFTTGTKEFSFTQSESGLSVEGIDALTLKQGTLTMGGTTCTAAEGGAGLTMRGENVEFTSGAVALAKGQGIYVGASTYTAGENGAELVLGEGKDYPELLKGEVEIGNGAVYVGEKLYESEAANTRLSLNDKQQVVLEAGKVSIDTDTSLMVGDTLYTAAAKDTMLTSEGDQALLINGAVAMKAGESILAGSSSYLCTASSNKTVVFCSVSGGLSLIDGTLTLESSEIRIGGKSYGSMEGTAVLYLNGVATPVLQSGSILLDEGARIVADGTTFTAANDDDAILSLNEEGKAQLEVGIVAMTAGEVYAGKSLYQAAGDGATFALGAEEDYAELVAGTAYLGLLPVIVNGYQYATDDNGGVLSVEEGKAPVLESGVVRLDDGAVLVAGGKEYTAVRDSTWIDMQDEQPLLTSGAVALKPGQSIMANGALCTADSEGAVLSKDEKGYSLTGGTAKLGEGGNIWLAGHSYTSDEGATLQLKGAETPKLTSGSIKLDNDASIIVNGTEYTADATGAAIALDGDKAKLTEGAVALGKGESIQVGDLGTIENKGDTPVTVPKDGKVSLSEGQSVTISDDKCTATYTMAEDGKTLTVVETVGGETTEKEYTAKSGEDVTIEIVSDGGDKVSGVEGDNPDDPRMMKKGETIRPEEYDVNKDVIKLAGVEGNLSPDKIIVSEDGRLTYGDSFADGRTKNGVADLSAAEKGGSYMVRLADKDGRNAQMVAWSGERSSVLDLRAETKGAVMEDGGNGESDSFYGGRGNDTITLGAGDMAMGGAGRDLIIMGGGADGAEVALQDGDGHDSVQGFAFGFSDQANVVNLNGSEGVSQLSVEKNGRLKVGGATLDFAGKDLYNSAETDLLVKDGSGTHKAAIGNNMAAAGDELADVYYGTGKAAHLDLSGADESEILIDLNNSGAYGKTSADVYGVKEVTGARGADNMLIGQDGKSNILTGGADGANSLYGGAGGRDTLRGSSSSEDAFYFGLGSGKDTVENFDTEKDKLVFLDGNYAGAKLGANGHLKFKWQQGLDSASMTLSEDVRDKVITYDFGDGEHGAKFGSRLTVTDDTADLVNFYSSGGTTSRGELVLSGEDSKEIWLDGSHGTAYDGFRIIDASSMSGDAVLAGGERSDTIIAGRGDASLWGGTGSGNDTLTGGRGENEFYFGLGEGKDVITSSNNDDKVMLYNVKLEDIDGTKTGVNKQGNMVIALNDGSSLTIRNYLSHGAETFQLEGSAWSYDKQEGNWQQVTT